MLLTGNPIFDVLGSAMIGVLLVIIAAFLAMEMKSLLVGEAATIKHQEAIAEALQAPETIDRVIHMRTMHLGPEELLVAAKLAVGRTDHADVVARAIDDAERAARAAVPDLDLVIYIEPDVDRDAGRTPTGERLAATGGDVPHGEHADGG